VNAAKTMISGTWVLESGTQSWTLTPDQIVTFMDMTETDQNGVATLVPFISATKMKAFLDSVAPSVVTQLRTRASR